MSDSLSEHEPTGRKRFRRSKPRQGLAWAYPDLWPILARFLFLLFATAAPLLAGEIVLTGRLHHLRHGPNREWSAFPEQAESKEAQWEFDLPRPPTDRTLQLRHRDLKQRWQVFLNDRLLAPLAPDENDIVSLLAVPAGVLKPGKNRFVIKASGKESDDIWLGEARLLDQPLDKVLHAASVSLRVRDVESGLALPCRLSIVDRHGSLMTTGAASGGKLAVRPGVVYTADGQATIDLPAGAYTIYAGRGFEYSVASTEIDLSVGDHVTRDLSIRREVATPGYVCCDTHVHTLTYSGHGDCTLAERLVTLAGEGIELPIATDHNVLVDYDPAAREAGVRKWFTPVVGEEVTTKVGHFNVFPIRPEPGPIDFHGQDWASVFADIERSPGVQVVVLNHARDIHAAFRPFDPRRHIALAGEDQAGWRLKANAMEVLNSGATQNEPLRLVEDWLGLLNRGLGVAPVGASDSHDVARYIVGQGRTYVRSGNDEPDKIDVAAACRNFAAGQVLVSYGLLTEISVNNQWGPGDLVPTSEHYEVRLRVKGPPWTSAKQVLLFANGRQVRSAEIGPASPGSLPLGVKWEGSWSLDRPSHDLHLVAVALGTGETGPFWPMAKPYQPTSPDWHPYSLAVTGAVRIDADGDGHFASPYEQAEKLADAAGKDLAQLAGKLADYDEAVVVQAASILRSRGVDLMSSQFEAVLSQSAPIVRRGFSAYVRAWKESLAAQAAAGP